MLSPAFALIIYGVSKISSHGGLSNSEVFVPMVIGFLMMVAFILYSLRRKISPVLDLHLFKSRNFSTSIVLLFVSGIATNGAMLLLPLYYQQVRGETALLAVLWLIPQGIGMLLTRGWLGRLTDRIGSRTIVIVSLLVTTMGTLPFAFASSDNN